MHRRKLLKGIPAESRKKFQATLGSSFRTKKWSNDGEFGQFELGDQESFETPGPEWSCVDQPCWIGLALVEREISKAGQKEATVCPRQVLVYILAQALSFPALVKELCADCCTAWPGVELEKRFVKILSGLYFLQLFFQLWRNVDIANLRHPLSFLGRPFAPKGKLSWNIFCAPRCQLSHVKGRYSVGIQVVLMCLYTHIYVANPSDYISQLA